MFLLVLLLLIMLALLCLLLRRKGLLVALVQLFESLLLKSAFVFLLGHEILHFAWLHG